MMTDAKPKFSSRRLSATLRLLDPDEPARKEVVDAIAKQHGKSYAETADVVGRLQVGHAETSELSFVHIDRLVRFAKACEQKTSLEILANQALEAAISATLVKIETEAYLPPSALRELDAAPFACAITRKLLQDGPSVLTRRMLRSLRISRCFSGAESTIERLVTAVLPRNLAPNRWERKLCDRSLELDCLDQLVRGRGLLALPARRQAARVLAQTLVEAGERGRLAGLLGEVDRLIRTGHIDGKVRDVLAAALVEANDRRPTAVPSRQRY